MGKKSRNRRAAAAVKPSHSASSRAAGSEAGGTAAPGRPRQSPLASASPGAFGVYLGIPFGVGLLVLGLLGWFRADPLPFVLVLALCLAGALEATLCWRTLFRSRVAWSFAVTLSGTLTLAFLFGAPKIRDTVELPIGVAIVPSMLALIVTCLLAAAGSEVSSRSS